MTLKMKVTLKTLTRSFKNSPKFEENKLPVMADIVNKSEILKLDENLE